ncbi:MULTISPECIES: branched-chain amino acid ABC transporter permease [Actinomadura]|jgi:branched-chain amino acid transport system permease protein|uniref:Branched-chain amino acid ABC transporter permease n=1 Tax=Actinomadura geliboluensis TaxID=882440 RepID=A0A5S4H324_9ACTN|nr:branched-chain amino acid ABC transporter permease [Actinomadura geliboluensis]TMR39111.1 branched-chain amino acid ABC transporter permease [Actinomadura geliboluensis]
MSAFLQYLISGVATGCGFALLASGLVAIHRVTRVVNFAQGMFAVVGGMAAGSLLAAGLPHGAAEAAAVAVAGLVGLAVGAAATGKRGTSPQSALIVTLGVGFLAYAVEIMIWGDNPRSHAGLRGAVTVFGAHVQQQSFLVIGVAAAVFALLALFFGRTYPGKALSACASNPYAARTLGIDPLKMGLLAFALGGMLGGLAGVLLTPLQPISYNSDVLLITNGFAAAVLGGLNRPVVALAGALTLGVAEAMVAGYGEASYQTVVALALMLAIMMVRASRRTALQEEAAR